MFDDIKLFIHKSTYFPLSRAFKLIRKHDFQFYNFPPKLLTNAIYAVNHSCSLDIPYACEAINKHCYVLIGKQPLNIIDRVFFKLNGAVWVDRKDKLSRNRASCKMINLLNNGANILLFPEGTWNLTPSKPMLPLYWGIIDIAKQSKKPIIPIVLEYCNEKCIVAFGESIIINDSDDKKRKIMDLIDAFASLKWAIWENYTYCGYNSFKEWEKEIEQRISDYPKLNIEYETSIIRKEFDTEAFAHLSDLCPNRSNAFLFNKRLK